MFTSLSEPGVEGPEDPGYLRGTRWKRPWQSRKDLDRKKNRNYLPMQQTHPHMTDQTRVCHEPTEKPCLSAHHQFPVKQWLKRNPTGNCNDVNSKYPAFLYQPSQMASKLPLSSNWYPWKQTTIMSDDTVVCLITLGINNFLTSVKLEALSSQSLWSWGSSWIKPAKRCNPFQDASLPQLLVFWYCVCMSANMHEDTSKEWFKERYGRTGKQMRNTTQ